MSEVVDTFLNAGFSKEEASKVIDFWMKAKVNPFSKTEISKKIDDLFLFFDEFSVSKNVAKKAIVKEPRLLLTTSLPMLRKNLLQNAKLLKIEPEKLVSILVKQPSLLTRKPEGLFSNLIKNAKTVGVESVFFLEKSLKHPTLLAFSSEYVMKNVTLLKKGLNLDEVGFSKLFKEFPNILTRSPETVLNLIQKISEEFDVSKDEVQKSFLKAPSLLSYSDQNLIEKINVGMQYFGLPKEDICKMYLFAPALLQVSPDRIHSNVSKVADIFSTDSKTIITSFLKMPALFLCAPNSIKEKYDFYKQMYLDDAFCLGNEIKKDLNLLKNHILKNAKEMLVPSMQSLEVRRAYGLWIKENQGTSSKAPIWKRPSKIMDDLKNVPDDFWKRNPALFQAYLKNQKGK